MMNYDDMPAGLELDALVAERVMGYVSTLLGYTYGYKLVDVPPFSADIASAWKVVENIHARGLIIRVSNGDGDSFDCDILGTEGHVSAETWPLAICRAALKAMEVFE